MLNKVNNTIRTSGDSSIKAAISFLIKENFMEKLTFTIDGHSFSTAIDTAAKREQCAEKILSTTGRHYSWYKENTGNKNWILYDTEQYEVRNFDDIKYLVLNNRLMDVKTFLCVRRDFKGKLHLPINASTCSFMFVDSNVPEIDLTEFDTTNVVDMDYMFLEANLGDCLSLVSSTITQANTPDRNILTLNTEGVTSMSGMFKDCKVKHLDLNSLRTHNVTDFSDMFCSCNDLIDLNVDGFDTSNAEDFHGMFQGCIKLTQLNVKHFNVDNVLHMSCLFSKCLRLKVIDLESWNFSQVRDANEMFTYCEKLEKIIANFNFKMIKEMAFMFCYCTKLSKVDLSHSDLSHVFDFGYTFFKCEGLKDIRFSQGVWLKAKFTLSMFDDCKALERLNLPDVILDDVIRSYAMFDDCDNLKEIYMEHPLNLDKYEYELIFGNCKAEVKKSTEWQ